MKNFIFKSPETYQKIVQLIDARLNTNGQNILYITYRVDKILHLVEKLVTDKGLQKQVDEYFEDETSPQTDEENKREL